MCLSARALRVLPVLLVVAACAGTPVDQRALTRVRLSQAVTPEARVLAVAGRFRDFGLSPLARGRFTFGTPPVVAAFVPGHDPILRGDLVVVTAGLSGPDVAEVLEAGRLLVAMQPDNEPRRSVLVAFWPAGLEVEAGLASVAAVPVWPDSARTATLVVGATAAPPALAAPSSDPAALVAAILALADREPVGTGTLGDVPR